MQQDIKMSWVRFHSLYFLQEGLWVICFQIYCHKVISDILLFIYLFNPCSFCGMVSFPSLTLFIWVFSLFTFFSYFTHARDCVFSVISKNQSLALPTLFILFALPILCLCSPIYKKSNSNGVCLICFWRLIELIHIRIAFYP